MVTVTSLTAVLPFKTVPVMTVPWPRIEKQWSTENINSPSEFLVGIYVLSLMVLMSSVNPIDSASGDACGRIKLGIQKT